ncbi:MAG TPA: response regulator [Candidatus Acidoferrum sp.]|nr:response regulator [Candidatus Acidoferrum sp.]
MAPLRALIIEDSDADCELLVRALRHEGYDLNHEQVSSAASLKKCLACETWDIIISDYSIPGFSGTEALKIVRERNLDTPFIFVSGTIGEDIAVDAMRHGAHDYVMKGNLARLLPAISRELREAERRRDHRRSEQRIRQLEKFEAIGKLAGGIAHDFNNAIGAVLGWAELGLDEADPGSRTAKYFENIRLQSKRASDLTRQLLAYARRQVLEPRNIDLNHCVAETVGLLQRIIGEQIEIKLMLSTEPQVVRADPVQIEQVFMNLCLNARDAMPKGGKLIVETVATELDDEYTTNHGYARPGKYVKLSVSDTGIGMDEATIEHIFDPFFTTKEIGKGTGLGLATALGVVKQHEGTIEVYSEVGKGTVFHVYLPTVAAAVDNLPQADNSPIRGGVETILVAEDSESIREMVQEALEGLGYTVIPVHNGEEALVAFRDASKRISLILMDLVMPGMGGVEAYAAISKITPGIPVIFMSGYSPMGAPQLSSTPNPSVLLQKPFNPKQMARKVREVLDSTVSLNSQ